MRIIAFVNKGSGGNEGDRVLDFLKNKIGEENVFDIKSDGGPNRGLDERASDPSFEVRIIVAGGDGTFSWVANAVEERNLTHVRLIIIPLGSGNDMARALGWGKKFPGMNRLPEFVDGVETAYDHKLDVWKLKAVPREDAPTPADDDGIAHGARPLMCNYLSFGCDAFVELRFNQLRWNNPDKYKSRLGNFRAHAVVGAKYMMRLPNKKIHISDHIEQIFIDDKELPIPKNLQAIIFLNIPSYGAGTQPWGTIGHGKSKPAVDKSRDQIQDMLVDDHKFEVIGLKNLTQFGLIKLFGAHGVRLAQGKKLKLVLKSESSPFQVDGEPWEQNGGVVTMEAGNPIGVLEGPEWNAYSKRNAKFSSKTTATTTSTDTTGDDDDDDDEDEENENIVVEQKDEGVTDQTVTKKDQIEISAGAE